MQAQQIVVASYSQTPTKKLTALLLTRGQYESNSPVSELSLEGLDEAAGTGEGQETRTIDRLYELNHWNGRLRVPLRQLEQIADIRESKTMQHLAPAERQIELEKRISRIHWSLDFKVKVQSSAGD